MSSACGGDEHVGIEQELRMLDEVAADRRVHERDLDGTLLQEALEVVAVLDLDQGHLDVRP